MARAPQPGRDVAEAAVSRDGVEIVYERRGSSSDPTLLLIAGVGMSLEFWEEDFCDLLVAQGFQVVRFDNRDTGRSTKFDTGPAPKVLEGLIGVTRTASYTLDAMVDDTTALADELDAELVGVVGCSLGGMVAQAFAVRHPGRVASLASIASSTGNRWIGRPSWKAMAAMLAKVPEDRDEYVEHMVAVSHALGAPRSPGEEERLRRKFNAVYGRGRSPLGAARQMMAILAAGDRTRTLRQINAPTVVIHGQLDPLIRPAAGRATARAIPNATYLEIPGMGHVMPPAVWPSIIEAIAENARRPVVRLDVRNP